MVEFFIPYAHCPICTTQEGESDTEVQDKDNDSSQGKNTPINNFKTNNNAGILC